MTFKDTPDGQTHYNNDGCGEPAHNTLPSEPKKCCQVCWIPLGYGASGCGNHDCKCHTSPSDTCPHTVAAEKAIGALPEGYVCRVCEPSEPQKCTKCGSPFLQHHHQHHTRLGVFHTGCYFKTYTSDIFTRPNPTIESNMVPEHCTKCGKPVSPSDSEPMNKHTQGNEHIKKGQSFTPSDSVVVEEWEERLMAFHLRARQDRDSGYCGGCAYYQTMLKSFIRTLIDRLKIVKDNLNLSNPPQTAVPKKRMDIYITLKNDKVDHTIPMEGESIIADLNAKSEIIGIEVLGATAVEIDGVMVAPKGDTQTL